MPLILLSPHPEPGTQALVWELIRGSGLLAYIALSISTILGIAITVRAFDSITKRAYVYEGHQSVSIAALVLTGIHMVMLLFDKFVGFSVAAVLVPFAAGWRPWAVVLGIGAFYITLIVTVTSYIRPQIGQKAWRAIHYSSFAAWGFAALHGLTAGSDTGEVWVQYLYLGTAALVVLITTFRFLAPRGRQAGRLPAPESSAFQRHLSDQT
jgi:predicted ferric reductase